MIELIKICLLSAIVPFAFSMLLDVCLGHPAASDIEHVDIRAIFFDFPFWLAKRRLIKLRLYDGIFSSFKETLFHDQDVVREVAKKNFKQAIFSQGREYFSWELGFGMCPVCTNVRISILFALFCILLLNLSWLSIIFIPCFSNLFLLFFNKLKS